MTQTAQRLATLDAAVAKASPSREFRTIVLTALQLLLVLFVIYDFQIESRTFFHVMLLASAGFLVHAFLPIRMRLGFFTILSFASIFIAVGFVDGISIMALGLVLLGICHLPMRLRLRVSLLVAVGTIYALWRLNVFWAPWSLSIWPILASMFMFRLSVYLYTVGHDGTPSTPIRALAYFFMLPNVCFPLFPVVDYSTFVRRYFDRAPSRLYETGMTWIVRGLVHLILYRYLYLQLAMDPNRLRTLGDLVQFIVTTFLLYLRVSGQFHLIAGTLHLFGFRLPATHHQYYLASSFTDFWRRINIYWKDYMMKLVYYPSYFALRRRGGNVALVGATIIVFISTWLLHSYQWFWLRGGFPLTPQDGLFWGILGILVVFGSVREMNRPAKRTLGKGSVWSANLALRRLATFIAICLLWSLWTSDSIGGWIVMWIVAGNVGANDLWMLAGLLCGGFLLAGARWPGNENYDNVSRRFIQQPALRSIGALIGILVIAQPDLFSTQSSTLSSAIAQLKENTLNERDAALQHKGYYENLDNASRMSAQLWNIQSQKPANWVGLTSTDAHRSREDFLRGDLRPGAEITFLDQPLTVNRWGMRDRDYPLEKPAGTYRIAVLGPSIVMGSGVRDGQTFADVLEERLNLAIGPDRTTRFEVLNFGVAGCSLLFQLGLLEERALNFDPNVVIISDSNSLNQTLVDDLLKIIAAHYPIPYPNLVEMLRQTGTLSLGDDGFPVPFQSVRGVLSHYGMPVRISSTEAEYRLHFIEDQLVRWTLEKIAAVTRAHGAIPVFLALGNVVDPPTESVPALAYARSAGYLVFDVFDLWQSHDKRSLRIAGWDNHPNAEGHRLIAERLLLLIQEHQQELGLGRALGVAKASMFVR